MCAQPLVGLEPAQHLPAVDAGQDHVEHDRVRRVRAGAARGRSRRWPATSTAVAGAGQVGAQQLGRLRVVLDQQDAAAVAAAASAGRGGRSPGAAAGSRTRERAALARLRPQLDLARRAPRPAAGSAPARARCRPRCRSGVADLLELLEDPVLVGRRRCRRRCRRRVTSTSAPSARAVTVIAPPVGVNLIALESRLSSDLPEPHPVGQRR